MATVILNHKVIDYNTWRPYFDADVQRRNSAGLKEIKIGRNSQDPNHIFMIFEASDPLKAASMMNNDAELKEVMKKAGVISPPEVVILD